MDKKNYRESLEKDRQEIVSDSSTGLSRRAQRHSSNQKKPKSRNLLLPVLFFIFILIPVTLLIYVVFIFQPDDTLVASENKNEVNVESPGKQEETSVLIPEETEEEVADASVDQEAEQSESSDVKTVENVEEVPGNEVSEETVEAAEGEQTAEPETQQLETPVTETPEESADTASNGEKTVIVKENETLYRIAVNNYGSSGAGAAVEKIKQTNGLSSNEIHVGQTLILP